MKFLRPSYTPVLNHEAPEGAVLSSRDLWMGIVLAAIGSAMFACKAILIKLAYVDTPSLEPLSLLAIRMGLAIPAYFIIGIWAWRSARRRNKMQVSSRHLWLAGITGLLGYYTASLLDFTGLSYITAQLERLILFTYPAFVMILGAMFFGQKITKIGAVSLIISYMGLALIFARGSIAVGDHLILGSILVFGAALSFALFQLLAASQIKAMGASLFTCTAMIFAGGGVLIHFALSLILSSDLTALSQPRSVWMYGGAITVFSTLIPSFLVNIALGRIGAQAVAVIGMASPIATIVLAVTLLNEPFGWIDGFGTLITIVGIGLFTWFSKSRPALSGNLKG